MSCPLGFEKRFDILNGRRKEPDTTVRANAVDEGGLFFFSVVRRLAPSWALDLDGEETPVAELAEHAFEFALDGLAQIARRQRAENAADRSSESSSSGPIFRFTASASFTEVFGSSALIFSIISSERANPVALRYHSLTWGLFEDR